MMRDQADISQDLRVLETLGLDAFDYETVKRYRIRLIGSRPGHVWENLEDIEGQTALFPIPAIGAATSLISISAYTAG